MIEMKAGAVNSLGRIGENEYRTARFDVGGILREFPEAAFQVVNQRPGDPAAYPVNAANVARDGESLLWTLTSADLASDGIGSCEVIAYNGEAVAKSEIYTTRTGPALDGSGTPPEPWESWVEDVMADADRAEAAAALLEHPGAEAETLSPGESATAAYADGVFSFGIPQGDPGDPGPAGHDGAPGKDGADGAPGKDGKDGKDGADGHTPVKGTDYWTAEDQAEIVAAAAAAAAGEVIDDTAGDGDTGKTWSADKLYDLNGAIDAKYTKPQTGIPASDLESGVIPSVPVQDVQVNGTSVLSQGVANVPQGSSTDRGVFLLATTSDFKQGESTVRVVTPGGQHRATFYGLAKAAGADMASVSGATVGVYPEAQKKAIRMMLGIPNTTFELIKEITTNEDLTEVAINTDSNGSAFKLSRLICLVDAPASTTGNSDSFYGEVSYTKNDDTNTTTSFPSIQYPGATSKMLAKIDLEANKNAPITAMIIVGNSEGNSGNVKAMPKIVVVKYIRGIRIYQSGATKSLIPSGTNIKLYGIRYDE